ncbi:hypothetical protein EDB83DRAFT_2428312 [Lactarius deliciosus]|nr:hypothetical protein EDB83DRAFT_2475044 [Lactarius deliciosus]KAH9024462.1 hypothetical protein EDB83DRAFT_2428312 [Lactarius deliciosus]
MQQAKVPTLLYVSFFLLDYVCPSFPNQTACAMDGRANGRRRGPCKMPGELQEVILSIKTPVKCRGQSSSSTRGVILYMPVPEEHTEYHITDTDPLVAPHAMEVSKEDPRSI